jgi:hypothetical protein
MATGFYLYATDGTLYNFGNVSAYDTDHGQYELDGRINGMRYDLIENWDRCSLRVSRCTLVTSNFP